MLARRARRTRLLEGGFHELGALERALRNCPSLAARGGEKIKVVNGAVRLRVTGGHHRRLVAVTEVARHGGLDGRSCRWILGDNDNE